MKKSNLLLFFIFIGAFVFVSIFGNSFDAEGFFMGSFLGNKVWQLIIIGIVIFILGKDIVDDILEKEKNSSN